MLGPYSASSALSPTHYKLVEALEAARSPAEHDRVLDACLVKIHARWSRSLATPSQAARDLILILYCHSQRALASRPPDEPVLLHSVRLAGAIGLATLSQRQIGYRACIELFPSVSTAHHSLKLLLINTIRADLYAKEVDSNLATLRWKMALRAITTNLTTIELVTAVEERVLEILEDESVSHTSGMKSLALDALAVLVAVAGPSSNLAVQARETLSRLLLASSSSLSPSSSAERQPPPTLRRTHKYNLPTTSSRYLDSSLSPSVPSTFSTLPTPLTLKLIDHGTSFSPSGSRRSAIFRRRLVVDQDYVTGHDGVSGLGQQDRREGEGEAQAERGRRRTTSRHHRTPIVVVGFAFERFLRRLGEVMRESRAEKDHSHDEGKDNAEPVEEEIKARLEVILVEVLKASEFDGPGQQQGDGIKRALVLSLVQTLAGLSVPLRAFAPGALLPLLAYLGRVLIGGVHHSNQAPDPNERLFVLETLASLPVDSWTRTSDAPRNSKGKGRETDAADAWGEQSWKIILAGLRDRDDNIRQSTIRLLSDVDGGRLVDLHYSQLVSSLSVPSQRTLHRDQTVPLLLELLPYLSTSRTTTTTGPRPPVRRFVSPSQLVGLIELPSLFVGPTTVIPELVLRVLDDFRHRAGGDEMGRLEFARALASLPGVGRASGFRWGENVMLGLLFAGTVHVVGTVRTSRDGSSAEGLSLANEIGRWLNDDDEDDDVKAMLLEPFLLALARLSSLSIPPALSSTGSTNSRDVNPERLAALSALRDSILLALSRGRHTYDSRLLLDSVRSALATEDSLERLGRIGAATRDASLAEFGHAFSDVFDPVRRGNDSSNRDEERELSFQDSERHQGGQRLETGAGSNLEPDDRIDEITRSIAALKREQAELKRERLDRGGAASTRGKVESLMGPDAAVDERRGDERAEIGSSARDGDGESEEDELGDYEGRERDTTLSTADGNEGNEFTRPTKGSRASVLVALSRPDAATTARMIPPILKSRPAYLVLIVVAGVISLGWFISSALPRGAVAYSLRPLWDRPEAPSMLIPHLYADHLEPEELCRLHHWRVRDDGNRTREVWDAVIFSTEVDLLLVRLDELNPLVDKFFILDSDTTFTGNPKPLVLADALTTPPFAPYRDKIVYSTFRGHKLEPGEDPFHQEAQMRMQMTDVLKRHFPTEDEALPPVMVFSDLDEVPSFETVQLLKTCAFESPLHLGMRSFLYSFEWEEGGEAASWRPQAWIWEQRGNGFEEYYRHGKVTDRVLVDSGWHCSWCFRTIAEFITKAQGYSHVDRLGSRPAALLRPHRIQETICKGLDMFSMLPEAYTYREFIMKLNLIPSKSAMNVPDYVVRHADALKYLLPGKGNCIREDAP
ncbi:hypothetical protein JCM11491_004350 [Sporobolomyces phaffii]